MLKKYIFHHLIIHFPGSIGTKRGRAATPATGKGQVQHGLQVMSPRRTKLVLVFAPITNGAISTVNCSFYVAFIYMFNY